jgi:hypothetical protein
MSVAVYVAFHDANRHRAARDSPHMSWRLVAGAIIVIAAVAAGGCGADEAAVTAPAAQPAQPGFVPLTTAQAAQKAQRIAVVVSRGSRVVEGMPDTPFTRTRFTVQNLIKGRLPHTFAIEVIGGRLGNRFVTSPVQPFTKAHGYVLFLGRDGRVGPTIFPQSVIELGLPGGPRLDAVLASIRRSLSSEGSP